jgi:molybdopterin-guanine dinucleotide biosynthesis protein A
LTDRFYKKIGETVVEQSPCGALSTAYKQRETGYVEAPVAVYEQGALPLFQEHLARRLLKIRCIVPLEQQHFLLYSARDARYFFNINRPEDFESAKKRA